MFTPHTEHNQSRCDVCSLCVSNRILLNNVCELWFNVQLMLCSCQMKCLVSHRLAVALGIRRSSTSRHPPRLESDVPLRSDIDGSSIQHMLKNHCSGHDTALSPTADTKDIQLLVGEAGADVNRCIRQCTLVNVTDNSNCSSTTSASADELVKQITRLLQTKIDGKRTGDSEEDQAATDDWMLVARFIDRLCFIMFSLGLVAGTVAVLLMATLDG